MAIKLDELLTNEEQNELDNIESMRKKIINLVTDDGKRLPENKTHAEVLTAALSGIDSNIHKKAMLRSRVKSNEDSANAAAIVAEMLKNVSRPPETPINTNSPTLGKEITKEESIPGEKEIGDIALVLDDLNAR